MKRSVFLGVFLCATCCLFSNSQSLCDCDFNYLNICKGATQNDEIFAGFKGMPAYQGIVETVIESHGLQYLDLILTQTSSWVQYFDEFRKNDIYGGAHIYDYGNYGNFSPTTLRYIKVASDIFTHFGPWDNFDIIEIGAGYGGQCLIFSKLNTWKSYTIVDLPDVLPLIKKYLNAHGITNITLLTPDQLPENGSYDLAISNFAFSECVRSLQQEYLDKLLYQSNLGYMCCNTVDGSMTRQELTDNFQREGFQCEDREEEPFYWKGNWTVIFRKI